MGELQAIANKAAVSTEDGQEVIITGAMAFSSCFCTLVLSRPRVIMRYPSLSVCVFVVLLHGGDDIPSEFLENAKRIGEQALKILPQLCTPSGLNLGRGSAVWFHKDQSNALENERFAPGQPVDMTLIRTDVGCSDSPLHDKHTNWDPNGRTFFLNEIEYGGTTYFIRHLKEASSGCSHSQPPTSHSSACQDWVPKWAELYVNKSNEVFDKWQTKRRRALSVHVPRVGFLRMCEAAA